MKVENAGYKRENAGYERIFWLLLLITFFCFRAQLTAYAAGGPTTTDGTLKYQLISEEDRTVQVGTGNDEVPSATATGLVDKDATDIVIPDVINIGGVEYRVTKVSCYAFYNCRNIQSITIGKNVEAIGTGAFKFCTGVTRLNWNAKSVGDFAAGNINGYGNGFAYLGENTDGVEVVFSDDVERVPAYAFYTNKSNHQYCDQITKVTFGKNIKEIGKYAFSGSNKLKTISLPEALESVRQYSFKDCSALSSLTISDNVKAIEAKAFSGCNAITSLTIGKSLSTIANDAFSGCTELSVLNWNAVNMSDLPGGNGIFTGAGQNGDGVGVSFGKTVEHIPANLFCPKEVVSDTDNVKIKSISFVNSDVELTIGDNAFRNCSNLQSLTLPKNVTAIGKNAFYNCRNLKLLIWRASHVADFAQGNGVFENMGADTDGTTVRIDTTVTHLPAYVFAPNESYFGKNVNIGSLTAISGGGAALISVGDSAFRNCQSITNCAWNKRVQTIGNYAFWNCKGLTTIELVNAETVVGEYAFAQCGNVTDITLGEQLTAIGKSAFNGIGTSSAKRTTVYQMSDVALISGTHFNGSYFDVYCPLEISCEHGQYESDGDTVLFKKKYLYKVGKTVTLTVEANKYVGDAWILDRVTLNGEELHGAKNSFTFIMPATASSVMMEFSESRPDSFVAQCGQYLFETLEEAVEAVSENATIQLLCDPTFLQPLQITKSVTIDGNGHVISRDANIKMLVVKNNATLSLQNVTVDGAHFMGTLLSIESGCAVMNEQAVLKNNDMTTENTIAYGTSTVCVKEGCSFVMNGGTICNNTAPNGGAIYLSKNTTQLPGGEAAIYDGVITENKATGGSGGAIYVNSGALLSLRGGRISLNTATSKGAGVYAGADEIYVSGSPYIRENTIDGVEENVYLTSSDGGIVIDGTLAGADIGVTPKVMPSVSVASGVATYNDIQITKGASGRFMDCFTSDKSSAIPVTKEGEIYLSRPQYEITFDGNGGKLLDNGRRVDSITYTMKYGESLAAKMATIARDGIQKTEEPIYFDCWIDENGERLTSSTLVTGDMVYTAKWLYGKCDAPVFDVEAGTYYEDKTVAIITTNDEKVYYTLDGTIPKDDGSNGILYSSDSPIVVSEDVTIKAICTKEECVASQVTSAEYKIRKVSSVTIDSAPEKIRNGSRVTLHATVVTGNVSTPDTCVWSLDTTGRNYAEGTSISEDGNLTVDGLENEESITVVATASGDPAKKVALTIPLAISYPVICYQNESETDESKTVVYYEPGEEVVLTDVARNGYTFDGWAMTKDGLGNVRYKAGESFVMGTQAVTLYAQWTENAVTDVQVFLDEDRQNAISSHAIDCGASIDFTAKVNGTGMFAQSVTYTLVGEGMSKGTTVTSAGRLTIASDETVTNLTMRVASTQDEKVYTDVLISVRYYVTYNYGYGTESEIVVKEYMESDRHFVFKTPDARIGYTFAGWTVDGDSSGTKYAPGVSYNAGKGNIEVYAVWERNGVKEITVFDEQGNAVTCANGSCDSVQSFYATVTGTGEYSSAVEWSLTGNLSEGTIVSQTGDVTIATDESADELLLTVKSVEDNTCSATVKITIQYDTFSIAYLSNADSLGDDSALITGSMEGASGCLNHTVTIAACEYTGQGYSFVCWNTSPDGSGTVYRPQDELVMKKNLVLYAVWKKITGRVTAVQIARSGSENVLTRDTVTRGDCVTYRAIVAGEGSYDQAVVWSLEGNKSFATVVSDAGVLRVDPSEMAETIRVYATSVNNAEITGCVEISLLSKIEPDEPTPPTPDEPTPPTPDEPTPSTPEPDNPIVVPQDPSSGSGNTGGDQANTPSVGKNYTDTTSGALYQVNATGNSNEVIYKKQLKKSTKATVPDQITIGSVKYKVVGISATAFAKNKKLLSVKIGKNVRVIPNKAFSGCKKLKTVEIGSGVKEIGKQAFAGCSGLKKITIRSTVLKKVGAQAFKGIHAKAVIKVPKKRKKSYQKLLKKKGQKSSVKIS